VATDRPVDPVWVYYREREGAKRIVSAAQNEDGSWIVRDGAITRRMSADEFELRFERV
jgi:uncharacterized protein YdeI (BOF family)